MDAEQNSADYVAELAGVDSQGDATHRGSFDDDEEIELPSWVVPVAEGGPVGIENEGAGLAMHGDRDEDAADVEVTREGEWAAEASEVVEPTDDVVAEQFDDDAS